MAADLADVLDRAAAVLAELREVDLDGVDDASLSDAVLAMQRLRGGLEAAEARVLSRWDAQGCWRASGAKTGAAWLAWQQRVPIQVARQRLRHARALRTLPAVEEAWAAGDIDRAHVTTLLGIRTARTPRPSTPTTSGSRISPVTTGSSTSSGRATAGSWWSTPTAPSRAPTTTAPPGSSTCPRASAGMWFGRRHPRPRVRRHRRHHPAHDRARALRHRLGRSQGPARPRTHRADLQRTPAQRRADALVEMATRARTAPPGGRRPAPLFTVVVGLETLQGPILELFNRTVLTPGTAAAHLTEADVERVVFDGPSRVLDVGAQRRFFPGALRRAIEIRDRTCFHPSCDEVPQRPEIDHIHEAAKGGETTQDNGRGGCGFHNLWPYRHPDPDPDNDPPPPLA